MYHHQNNSLSEIIAEFEEVLYPTYSPGISPNEILPKYDRLKQQLQRIDSVDPGSQLPSQIKESLHNELIRLLNEACTFTHRSQISNFILNLVHSFTHYLARLPVGRMPITVSEWMEEIHVCKLTQYKQTLKYKDCLHLEPQITAYLDKTYQQQKRINNLDHLFLSHPKFLVAKIHFQDTILNNSQSVIPTVQKLYLGIIAASTYGCKYVWNLLVKKFLSSGGDPLWISQGIYSYHVPLKIKKVAEISWVLAYQFNKFISEDLIASYVDGHDLQESFFIEATYIIVYYQSLSCFALVTGLTTQSNQLLHHYLPKHIIKPSPQSFNAMLHKQYKDQMFEQERAADFASIFTAMSYENEDEITSNRIKVCKKNSKFWHSSDEEQDFNPKRRNRFASEEKINSDDEEYFKQNSLKALAEEEMQYQKLKNMRTLDNIKSIYNRFINYHDHSITNITNSFDNQVQTKLFKKSHEKQMKSSNDNCTETNNQIIYASDWQFQSNALNSIQLYMNHKFSSALRNMLESMRYNTSKSKSMKVYYEMVHNYLYECVDYPKLMNEELTSVEKNFVKLVTKSPFLFNSQSFAKIRQQLELNNDEIVKRSLVQVLSQ